VTNEHCQPADHTTFATNNDAAANSLALELYCYWKPEAPCVGYHNANTDLSNLLLKRSVKQTVGCEMLSSDTVSRTE
jgi:hypothetical protein